MNFSILGGLALIFSSVATILANKDSEKKMKEAVKEEVKLQLSSDSKKEEDLD